ncbi:MAG: hypothetical protein HKL99_10520 [Burkholderiales bacterium]|nr:hypothetical protein [Burkholderiales bacterium]
MQFPLIQRFPINAAGRDFVLGDIHGAFDLVAQGLRRVQFDPALDRLFCVGDLVDRGPESHRALAFLGLPWVHSARGNHEDNLLQVYAEGDPDPKVLAWFAQRFHAQWWLDLAPADRSRFLKAFARMPIAIEVETPRGLVGIVHADVPAGMDWPTFRSHLKAGDAETMGVALEGRNRIKAENHDGVPGIGRVFVGHTPQWGGARRLGNVYAIDSGAVFGLIMDDHDGHLTMANLCFASQAIMPARTQHGGLAAVVACPEHEDAPFGAYARRM